VFLDVGPLLQVKLAGSGSERTDVQFLMALLPLVEFALRLAAVWVTVYGTVVFGAELSAQPLRTGLAPDEEPGTGDERDDHDDHDEDSRHGCLRT
jgi:hypothetical protein